jgi:hypothetical protein
MKGLLPVPVEAIAKQVVDAAITVHRLINSGALYIRPSKNCFAGLRVSLGALCDGIFPIFRIVFTLAVDMAHLLYFRARYFYWQRT